MIITHNYNRPDFIEIQAATFRKFLQDEYEYIVFNDAPNDYMSNEIELKCRNLNVRCIRIPQTLHINRNHPSERHADGVYYSFKTVGFDHPGIVVLIDADAFLIRPFSIEQYLADFDIAGELQGRGNEVKEIRYLSPVVVFMNMQTLPNRHTISFEGGTIDGFPCDNGAKTYFYLKENPTVKSKFFGYIHIGVVQYHLQCKNCTNLSCAACLQELQKNKFTHDEIQFIQNCDSNIEFYLNNTFMHYRGGTNWDYKPNSYHANKTRALKLFISQILTNE